MLVDARWPPSEPERSRRPIPWRLVLWPALTVLFLVVGNFMPPLLMFACVFGALYCAGETFLHVVPFTSGMKDYRQ